MIVFYDSMKFLGMLLCASGAGLLVLMNKYVWEAYTPPQRLVRVAFIGIVVALGWGFLESWLTGAPGGSRLVALCIPLLLLNYAGGWILRDRIRADRRLRAARAAAEHAPSHFRVTPAHSAPKSSRFQLRHRKSR